jgi:transcriptional regulator with XRE-family HTH domain
MEKRGRPKGAGMKTLQSRTPLGDLIRKARIKHKLGLAEVAASCHCSVQFISNIEHGRAPLPWDKAPALAKTLKISLNDLQSANLALRSDFREFMGHSGKKLKKPEFLRNSNEIASAIQLVSSDASIQEILKRYQSASQEDRKTFAQAAIGLFTQ